MLVSHQSFAGRMTAPLFVQRHEPVLLARDADGSDLWTRDPLMDDGDLQRPRRPSRTPTPGDAAPCGRAAGPRSWCAARAPPRSRGPCPGRARPPSRSASRCRSRCRCSLSGSAPREVAVQEVLQVFLAAAPRHGLAELAEDELLQLPEARPAGARCRSRSRSRSSRSGRRGTHSKWPSAMIRRATL